MECAENRESIARLRRQIAELERENGRLAGLIGDLVAGHDRMMLELIVTGALQRPEKASPVTPESNKSL